MSSALLSLSEMWVPEVSHNNPASPLQASAWTAFGVKRRLLALS